MDLARKRARLNVTGLAEAQVLGDEGAGPAEREAVEQALRTLDPDKRAVVLLKVFCGMTFNEVAEVVAANPKTVQSRYAAGLRLLAERYRDRGEA